MTFSASHTVKLIYRVAASRAAVTSVETADSSPSSPQSPASSWSHPPLPSPILSHLPSCAPPSRHVIPTPPAKPPSEPQPCSRCVAEEAAHRVSLLDHSDVQLLPALLPVSSGTRMWGMCRNHHLPWGILGRREVSGAGVKLKEGEAVLSPL